MGKSGLRVKTQETRLSGLRLIGLVGNEKDLLYGCDRSTDGMGSGREAGKYAGEVRRNVATLFTSRE